MLDYCADSNNRRVFIEMNRFGFHKCPKSTNETSALHRKKIWNFVQRKLKTFMMNMICVLTGVLYNKIHGMLHLLQCFFVFGYVVCKFFFRLTFYLFLTKDSIFLYLFPDPESLWIFSLVFTNIVCLIYM